LQVFGTPQSDNVTITAPARNRLKVTADFLAGAARKRVFAAAGVDGIDVFLFGGSDFAQIASNVKRWAFVDGGDGNDRLVAGGGWTVLVGGHGNDALTAGSGRDVLVGGYGRDVLTAGSAQSILLADATAFDSSDYLPGLPDELALLLILAEWNSKRSFATRRANLRDGSGSAERFNGDYFLQYGPTVFDDGVADRLIGSRKRNWWIGYP
jgi:Ca2+-binding RTX toxin-like protein